MRIIKIILILKFLLRTKLLEIFSRIKKDVFGPGRIHSFSGSDFLDKICIVNLLNIIRKDFKRVKNIHVELFKKNCFKKVLFNEKA